MFPGTTTAAAVDSNMIAADTIMINRVGTKVLLSSHARLSLDHTLQYELDPSVFIVAHPHAARILHLPPNLAIRLLGRPQRAATDLQSLRPLPHLAATQARKRALGSA